MKSIVTFLWFLIPSFVVRAQYLSANESAVNETNSVIDTSNLGTWPSLGNETPKVSNDGNFIAYTIFNFPVQKKTFVIQAINNSWKKEFVFNISFQEEYFFTSDGKKVIWNYHDSLFSLSTINRQIEFIAQAKIVKYSLSRNWIAYTSNMGDKRMVLINLLNGKEVLFDNVVDYYFNPHYDGLVVQTEMQVGGEKVTSLKWINLQGRMETNTIWNGEKGKTIAGHGFDRSGSHFAFLVHSEIDSVRCTEVWYYGAGMDFAIFKADEKSLGPSQDFFFGDNIEFSGNGKLLFLTLERRNNSVKRMDNGVNVDVWSYKDEILYPDQEFRASSPPLAVFSIIDNTILYIKEGDDELLCTSAESVSSDFIVIKDRIFSEPYFLFSPQPSYWLVSLKDGKKTLIKSQSGIPLTNFDFSPGGKWLTYWDCETAAFICLDLATGKSHNITSRIPPITKEEVTGIYPFPEAGIAGWYINDKALLIYDRFDIWKVDPSDENPPVNITNGFGKKEHIKLRIVKHKDLLNKETLYTGSESILLTGFRVTDKYNGFLTKNLKDNFSPIVLTMGPYTYYRADSQKPHGYSFDDGMQPVKVKGKTPLWVIKRQSFSEYPNYFLTKDFKKFTSITNLNPQKSYLWLTANLISWSQFDGSRSQGVLYKPENFDSAKRYPVIFNYYEKSSHCLYEFPNPGLTYDNINIPWFVTRGYLVFTPDIHYSIANHPGGCSVGEAAYNSVVSAAKYLSSLSYVDSNKMALQGHSFGGLQTNYIISHSKVFAAASVFAGTSDYFSSYLTLIRGSDPIEHIHKMDHPQGRMGATPWERRDLYLMNSAALNAEKIETPLLIVHNKKDGSISWNQGVELFMALRRLQKKCWMLQYDNGDHSLYGNDALDYTIRLTQFFDHYLKSNLAPRWMTVGVPAKLKAVETGYELDNSGYKP